MDFYSGKQPNLIGPIMKSTVCKVMKRPVINNTVSDKITTYVGGLYNDYIMEHKIAIFILVAFIGFLIYRYYNKKETTTTKESFSGEDTNLIKEIREYQTKHLQFDNPPEMNPTQPASQQEDLILYPPDPLPINIPSRGIVYSRDIYGNKQQPFDQLNNAPYIHDNVYTYPSNSYYSGAYNTYQNAQDTDIINPYDWSNNFNTNSGDFVGGMTNSNMQNMINYQTIQDNKENNLINALRFGANAPDYGIDPPYAQD